VTNCSSCLYVFSVYTSHQSCLCVANKTFRVFVSPHDLCIFLWFLYHPNMSTRCASHTRKQCIYITSKIPIDKSSFKFLWKQAVAILSQKLLVACRHSLTQRLVSWSSPVVPKVWTKTQISVEKGQKMGRAEAIQTGVVDFQRYHCLLVSMA